ncbi:hypothetical protein FQR65_LT15782 [Abscondita terminalis]|nr:hypothetical protein FQR65_LT15782 [Abscondita terminalis]
MIRDKGSSPINVLEAGRYESVKTAASYQPVHGVKFDMKLLIMCPCLLLIQNCISVKYLYLPVSLVQVMRTDVGGPAGGVGRYGSLLDVMAPGENILSTTFGNTTTYKDGTSMAAPHVAGITALMLSVAPDLTRGQVVDIFEKDCTKKVGGYSYSNTSGKPNRYMNNKLGYGLAMANAAVLLARLVVR